MEDITIAQRKGMEYNEPKCSVGMRSKGKKEAYE